MKKMILFTLIYVLIISCNKKRKIVDYYSNERIKSLYYLDGTNITGKYEEYYENGNPKAIYLYNMGEKNDSSIHYYENKKGQIKAVKYWKNNIAYYQKDFFENGKLMKEGGLLKDNFRIGKWHLYSPENYKSEVIEYFNINNASYINQSWKLDKNGDTLTGGAFYELRKKDTVLLNEPIRFHFFLRQRVLLNSELYLCFAKKGSVLKHDFSNQYEVLLDTVKNMSIELKMHPIFKHRQYDVLFDLMPRKKGHDTLRGFLLEKEFVSNNDTVDFYTRQFYFNVPYYVK